MATSLLKKKSLDDYVMANEQTEHVLLNASPEALPR